MGGDAEVYDTYDGKRGPIGNHWTYKVVQPGNMENDLVALRIFEGAQSTPVYVLRIRFFLKDSAGKPIIAYALLESGNLYTGLCTRMP